MHYGGKTAIFSPQQSAQLTNEPLLNFLLWVSRAVHVFGLLLWVGGLLYQEAVFLQTNDRAKNEVFSGFLTSGVRLSTLVGIACVGLTGIILMTSSPRFTGFQINDNWSLFLALKEIIFVGMLLLSLSYASMVRYLAKPASNGGYDQRAQSYRHRIHLFRRLCIVLGFAAVLLSSGMRFGE